MERKLTILVILFFSLTLVSCLTVTSPLFGLSTVLGSSVLGSSVLGSSVMSTTTIIEAYNVAIATSQIHLSLVVIGLLMYLEMSNPDYTRTKGFISDLRKSWVSVSALLVILFFIIVALKVWGLIA